MLEINVFSVSFLNLFDKNKKYGSLTNLQHARRSDGEDLQPTVEEEL